MVAWRKDPQDGGELIIEEDITIDLYHNIMVLCVVDCMQMQYEPYEAMKLLFCCYCMLLS